MSETGRPRVPSLIRWWARHPWIVLWTSVVLFLAAAPFVPPSGDPVFTYVVVPVVVVIAYASYVRGIVLNWPRAPVSTAILVGVLCASEWLAPFVARMPFDAKTWGFLIAWTMLMVGGPVVTGLAARTRRREIGARS